MNTRSFLLSILIAGVIIGFLGNLPVLNLINCAFCIWVWVGGGLAVSSIEGSSMADLGLPVVREQSWEQ